METTLKQAFVTTESKDGKPYINKNGQPFKMLHIELEDGRWASKYYSMKEDIDVPPTGEKIYLELKQNGQYLNLLSFQTQASIDAERINIEKWEIVCSDPNWDGNKDAQFMAENYGDEWKDYIHLCNQDIDDPFYDDGR